MQGKKKITVYIEPTVFSKLMRDKKHDTITHFCERAIIKEVCKDEYINDSKHLYIALILIVFSIIGIATTINAILGLF